MNRYIDRLSLSVPNLTEAEAARLGQLVTSGLAAAELPAVAWPMGTLRVDVPRGSGDLPSLSRSIVTEVLAALARSV